MNRYLKGLYALLMWASGTGFILITLSGETFDRALMLSVVTLIIMVVATALGAEE